MNDGTPPAQHGARTSARPLAGREDFRIGAVLVRPSLLGIEGPGGNAKGEPRVIRVLVALADARGGVLSRDDLLTECWDGLIVGDDAINRAVAELRRLLASVKADFEIETVPRVGYRLAGASFGEPSIEAAPQARANRRMLLAAGAAILAAGVGGTAFYLSRRRNVDDLVEEGRRLQASGEPDAQARATALFRQALASDPGRADAWGSLAAVTPDPAQAVAAAEKALAIDPAEANARSVVALQRRDLDDWVSYEDTLLAILRDAPRCAHALAQLTFFYQGMGRCRDSLGANERVIAVEPLNPSHHARRAMKHWIFGHPAQADLVANRALQLWPRNPTVWNARLITLAFTDRADAALVLLDDKRLRPVNLTTPSIDSWRAGLTAIAEPSAANRSRAVEAMTRAATHSHGLAANAIMTFSYLGLVDEAYRVAEGLLVQTGDVLQSASSALAKDLYAGPVWGRTQFVFVPACSHLREDPRFTGLCRRMGHVAYWQKRGIGPDAFVRGSLRLN